MQDFFSYRMVLLVMAEYLLLILMTNDLVATNFFEVFCNLLFDIKKYLMFCACYIKERYITNFC